MAKDALPSFETLRDQLAALSVPTGEARQLVWIVTGRLGAAMTSTGAFEIFLLGPPLHATSTVVGSNILHDRWEPCTGGEAFEASRVLLGSAEHFAAVAALIAIELGRLNLSTDAALQESFSKVEPIIELAIRRAELSREVIIGLIAELQVLRTLLLATTKPERPALLLSWRGYTSGRDFVLGNNGLEIKATLGTTSRHAFSGVHQLEPQASAAGVETLHLLSMGLVPVESGGHSLPELVDELLSLLAEGEASPSAAQTQLLTMIARYGGANAPNYEHNIMRGWSTYQSRFSITFTRLYDVADPAMRLLDRALIEATFAVPDSVAFELSIPSFVSAFNPAENWQLEISAMIRS